MRQRSNNSMDNHLNPAPTPTLTDPGIQSDNRYDINGQGSFTT